MAANPHTHNFRKCSHASVELAQACPKNLLPRQHHCRREIFVDVA